MISLRNHLTEDRDVDRLHKAAKGGQLQTRKCPGNACLGSTYGTGGQRNEVSTEARSPEDVKLQATDFLLEYYTAKQKLNSAAHKERLDAVLRDIGESNGTYELTEDELVFGAKLAWRNAPRCIGRIQWNNLKIFDARNITSAKEMFYAICRHIVYTTNGGNIRSTITVFPMRKPGKHDFRIWNHFIIGYAGYRKSDGTIHGHSINVELTEICLKLGWRGAGTKHDILPLVLSANGEDPQLFVIPPDIILEVNLSHPEYDWFKELDIRWFTLPLLSAMLFDCGGLQFPAAPFNGWFTAPEIASRDLGDCNKYNYIKEVAQRMGLDTKNSTSLWKDKAMVELNISVLHSFQKAGVTIIDHHTAAEQFMKHLENEQRERGGCPADWVWIVPPISGSTVPVFHQEMALYFLKPSYEYQQVAWKVHAWKDKSLNPLSKHQGFGERKLALKEAAFAVLFTTGLYLKRLLKRNKAVILYASETGKSEAFAKRLNNIFKNSFNVEVMCMDKYDATRLLKEPFIICVTSTFGNGDPPVNGEKFYEFISKLKLERILPKENKPEDMLKLKPLWKLKFAVFALGSSAYPNVCAFGRNLDYSLELLGGHKLLDVPCGNELSGQEETFRKWSRGVYQAACEKFSIEFNQDTIKESSLIISVKPVSVNNIRFRTVTASTSDTKGYKQVHKRDVASYIVLERENLHEPSYDAITIRVALSCPPSLAPLKYRVGDHIGVLPKNQSVLVASILRLLQNKPGSEEQPVEIEVQKGDISDVWEKLDKVPASTLEEILTKFLDITTPPSTNLLSYLSSIAKESKEKDRLSTLVNDYQAYEEWKEKKWPNLLSVLEEFPSCSPDAAVICSLLPVLQPRFYSVSSSSKVHPNQMHLTVGVVRYSTSNGNLNYGVCSNFLNAIPVASSVSCFVRSTLSSTFRMPETHKRPVIMIGPGTGIAPFRGFWQERKLLLDQGVELGEITLFIGCRTRGMVLYAKEIAEMHSTGILTNIFKAFSRETTMPKTYVQHLIKSKAKKLARQIMLEDAIIYVCGDVSMAESVFKTFQLIIQQQEHMEDEKAKDFMRYLKENDRYHMDIFGQTHKKPQH